ncbi:MAG TPA: hypothetical protein VMA83_00205 [Solirubrobacteraceae bacterium]|nr:hypothetical protein [Solirubrobacteraceae bacterium]
MIEKWADFLITAVRFNSAGTHIVFVEARADRGAVGKACLLSRTEVIETLESGYTYCTAIESGASKWEMGAAVEIVTVHDQPFMKTAPDEIACDNLGDVPRI